MMNGGGWRRLWRQEAVEKAGGGCGRSEEFAGGWRRLDGGWTEAGKGWRTLEEAGGWRLEGSWRRLEELELFRGGWRWLGEAAEEAGGRLEEAGRSGGGCRRLGQAGGGWMQAGGG